MICLCKTWKKRVKGSLICTSIPIVLVTRVMSSVSSASSVKSAVFVTLTIVATAAISSTFTKLLYSCESDSVNLHRILYSNVFSDANSSSALTVDDPLKIKDDQVATNNQPSTTQLTNSAQVASEPPVKQEPEQPKGPVIPKQCHKPKDPIIPELRVGQSLPPFTDLSMEPVREVPVPIYDVFMFNNEYAMLELRLLELYDVIDKFVLIEAPFTQSGNPKPLNFENNKGRYSKWMSKIVHIKHDAQHLAENGQRALAMQFLQDLPKDHIIILSDLDEVPSCWTVYLLARMERIPTDRYGLLEMPFHYYNYHWRAYYADRLMHIHQSTTAKVFYRSYLDTVPIQSIAFAHHHPDPPHWVFPSAGWHCSYCFAPAKVILKIQSLAHQENNRPPFTEMGHVVDHIQRGIDMFDRDFLTFRLHNSTDDLPYAVRTEPARFKLFYPDLDANGRVIVPADNELTVDEPTG